MSQAPIPLSELEAEIVMLTDGEDKERAILMLCPKCLDHYIHIPYADEQKRLRDMGPVWKRVSGTTLGDFTFTPSYHLPSSCGLHGWVRDGAWIGC